MDDERVKVLFLASNPVTMSALNLAKEVREIEVKVRASKFRDSLEFVQRWAVHPEDIQEALLDVKPQIVHFSGHGSDTDGLYFETSEGISAPVGKDALCHLLGVLKDNIRLVVLNACQTCLLAEAITSHIDCAIGMQTEIGDSAAVEFSGSFYRAIGWGRSVKVAFELGRSALMLKNIPEDKNPKLFTRAGLVPEQITLLRP